ncbi:MAG: DUF4115 domain-containing protein [Chloroflexota bacterium]|nr:DUF4115 domain-containing protein [Chloroflexota bacterium]
MSLLGERLRQARESRGISPLQVEIDTRIRASVIQAMEEGDFESLPPEPFLRGLVRSYSTYLGVDAQEMLELYAADTTPVMPTPPSMSAVVAKKPTAPTPPLAEPIKPPAPLPAAKPAPVPIVPGAPPPSTEKKTLATNVPAAPSAPPETLPPPEKFERAEIAPEPTAPPFLAHITRRGIPFPVIILVGIAIILTCVAGTLIAITKVAPAVFSLATGGTPTPTRALATRTPTLRPGAAPTSIPTLAVTAAPFATFPGNSTATLTVTPRRTSEATTPGLNLDIDVTQTITLQVGIDGVLVFSGQMQPGTSRSWSAKDTLYVRVENPRGAALSFNGSAKSFGARNFAERSLIERQWTLNDKGTPVNVAPVPPAFTPAAAPSLPRVNPSPTLTPFS